MSNADTVQSFKISDAERKALIAADPSAFDLDAAPDETLLEKKNQEGQDNSDGSPENADAVAETAGEGDHAADVNGDRKPVMIPKGRFDEALAKERERTEAALLAAEQLKARVEALEAKTTTVTVDTAPPKDFDAERAALRTKYNDGEIDSEQYETERDKLNREEARFELRQELAADHAAKVNSVTEAEWQKTISAWETDNKDFLANPFREKIVRDLFEHYNATEPNLSNAELLAKVERDAFEAANWKQDKPAVSARDRADAAAVASASSVPGAPTGGMGNRGTDADINLDSVKPGQFNKLSRAQRAELLGGEDAL